MDGIRPDIVKWTEEYQANSVRNPWYFVVQSANMMPGEGIRITMYPDIPARIKLGTMIEPESDDDIQVLEVIVDEVITERNSHELRETLTVIQKTQGLCFEDGLLLIVHLFFWLVDWDRNRSGEPSLLSGRTFRDEPDDLRSNHDKLMNVLRYYSMTSVDKLLRLWRDNQSLLIGGLVRPCPGKPGLPTYMYFPPHWLSPEDLRVLDGDEATVPQVPALIDADVVSLVPEIVNLLKARSPYQQLAQAESAGKAAASEERAFRYSPDFRTVNLRGKVYVLTTSQAVVVQCLWENYEQGTPDIGQGYLLEELLGGTRIRLKDVFKHSDALGELIVAGKKRGTVRLNI